MFQGTTATHRYRLAGLKRLRSTLGFDPKLVANHLPSQTPNRESTTYTVCITHVYTESTSATLTDKWKAVRPPVHGCPGEGIELK